MGLMGPTNTYLNSKRQAALYLGVSTALVERLVRSGILPYVRVGILYKFKPEDLAAYVERQRSGGPVKSTNQI